MDYIQKTIEEYKEKYCQRWDDETIILKSSVTNEQIEAFLTRALTEQGSLFRKGLGEEELFKEDFKCGGCGECEACKLQNDDVTAGSNMRRTQTLENWEKAGI